MIQFDKDGVTLFYLDADAKRISHNYMEGTAYDAMLIIRDEQIQAIRENLQTATNYTNVLKGLQESIDAGRLEGIIAPPKPLQKFVADTGEMTFVPFVPPLPDLVIPPAALPNPGKIVVPVVDKQANQQAIMYNMILAMFRKMFPEA